MLNCIFLASFASNSITSATVKDNGYGLGIEKVTKTLYSAGCRIFFVSHLSEAIVLNDLMRPKKIIIYILNGLPRNSIDDYIEQPKVINGASDLISSIFGEAGMHTRAAVSTNSLPLGVSVEVDGIFELN